MCYVSRLRVLRYTTEWEQIKNQEHFKSFYNRRSLQIVYFKTFGPPISRSIFVFHACHVNRIKRENSTVRYRKKKQPNYSIIFIVLIFVWNIFRRFLKSFFFFCCVKDTCFEPSVLSRRSRVSWRIISNDVSVVVIHSGGHYSWSLQSNWKIQNELCLRLVDVSKAIVFLLLNDLRST